MKKVMIIMFLILSSLSSFADPICKNKSVLDDPEFFAEQLYRDVLSRESDEGGLRYWTGRLKTIKDNCRSESDPFDCQWFHSSSVALEFLKHKETSGTVTGLIQSYYESFLKRSPDGSGLQYWVDQIERKIFDERTVLYFFLTGDEFRNRFTWSGSCDKPRLGVTGHPFTQVTYRDDVGVPWQKQIDLVKSIGSKYYRVDIGIPGPGADYSHLERLLNIADKSAVTVLPIIFAPINRQTMDVHQIFNISFQAAYDIAKKFKDRIKVWEVANEEDLIALIGPGDIVKSPELPPDCIKDQKWICGNSDGTHVNHYHPDRIAISKAYIQGMALGLRAADPTARFIVNFAYKHYGLIEYLMKTGVDLDIIGMHWYHEMGDASEAILATKRLVGGNKEIWMTEMNYLDHDGSKPGIQSKYLKDTINHYLHNPQKYPVDVLMVYELLNEIQFGMNVESFLGIFEMKKGDNRFDLGSPKGIAKDLPLIFR